MRPRRGLSIIRTTTERGLRIGRHDIYRHRRNPLMISVYSASGGKRGQVGVRDISLVPFIIMLGVPLLTLVLRWLT